MVSEYFSGAAVASIVGQSAALLAGTLLLYGIYKVFGFIYKEVNSSLRDLPGPTSKSFLYGHFKELWDSENAALQHKWLEDYGDTLQYKGFLGMTRLQTIDAKAINHIFMNHYDYQKPEAAIYNIKRLLGKGVLLVEGDIHKHQRKILNPAFGPQQIRELTEIFVEKSIQLRDIWAEEVARNDGTGRVDALSWFSRMTLDVVGLAGFNYKFNALTNDPKDNELNNALATLFQAGMKLNVIQILRGLFPPLRFLPARNDSAAKIAAVTMRRISAKLLEQSKASLAEEKRDAGGTAWEGRDLLSLLVRANAMPDLPESQRLSDKDVLAQIPTFIVAGHETTSVAATWALYALTKHKDIQSKLRQEMNTISTDNPTMDDLNSLPYLDAVVRETLRLYAPVPATLRVAMKDDLLPLSKPFIDRKGKVHHELQIRAGQMVIIPIALINQAKSTYGEDAGEFKPERWDNIPDAAASVPGVWGNMATFIGGPRACIGYRFSLLEMKALLYTLIRAFEFDLAVPHKDIVRKSTAVQRPMLVTDPDNGHQMPLLVRQVSSL
ncbi:cytochrome P450 [Crassisporium funariophilum]|nr:cytochrome P450 [Crassisporium funariophilum]